MVKFSNFQILRSTYSSFDASQEEEYDAGKMNAVSLLSQKLLQKTFFRKNGYFRVFAIWRPNRWS